MKRFITLSIVLMIVCSAAVSAEGDKKRFFAGFDLNVMFHADSTFKKVYSDNVLVPEFKAGYFVSRNILVWAAYGFYSKNGETEQLAVKTETKQSFLSFGAGYNRELGEKINLTLLAGICSVSYEEKALGEKVDGSAVGFRIDGLFQYDISSSVYSQIGIGYTGVSDSTDSGVDIKLGGFRISAGCGFRF